MKKLGFAAFLFFSAVPTFGALSPLNQSVAEIQSILQSKELQEQLPQNQEILKIKRTDKGYLLKTAEWNLFVEIQYLPSERIGPRQYKLNFHPKKKK